MDVLKLFLGFLFKLSVLFHLSAAQVVMEELKAYNIDPLNLNGTEPYTELTIDQIIMKASGGAGVALQNMVGDDGTILAELDMRLTYDQFSNLYEQPSKFMQDMKLPIKQRRELKRRAKKARRSKRKAIRDVVLRWDKGIIPYKYVTGHYKATEQYMIRSAMTEWEKYTCLKFRKSNNNDRNLVRFQNGYGGCNSQLGMVGGEQPLNLDSNGCRYKGLYLHEIGHAVGLVHEHQLPDRDKYIEILYHNVQPNMRIWFNKYSSQEVNQMDVKYEYSSVMHYGITAFAADGKSQTIKSKQPDKEKTIGRVYRKELSFSDVKIVNIMYGCAEHCSKNIVCNNGGFVDQNCKCICPDGTDDCTSSNTKPDDGSCYNAHEDWQCYVWANQGECERNPRFMLDGCKKACKLCGEQDEGQEAHITLWTWQWLCRFANICPKNWTVDVCEDAFGSAKCQVWKDSGECIVNKKWMEKNCRQTCNACKDSGVDPDVQCENEHKNITECEKWAAEGECIVNSRWMPKNCRKSCHMCTDKDKPTTPEPTSPPVKCEDIHNTVECKGWADSKECTINPDWMIPNCRKSCKKCDDGDSDTGKVECKNTWDDQQCEGWSRDQECMKNKVWMNKNCHKSCTKCNPDDGTVTDSSGKTQTTTVATTITTEGGSGTCVNNHKSDKECVTWAKYGHCQLNDWMLKHCAKACGTCDTAKTTTPKPDGGDDSSTCTDQEVHCGAWAKHSFCQDNPGMALRICRKSCNACNKDPKECFDKHQLCPIWKRGGQCSRNSGYMLRNCQKSCGVCTA